MKFVGVLVAMAMSVSSAAVNVSSSHAAIGRSKQVTHVVSVSRPLPTVSTGVLVLVAKAASKRARAMKWAKTQRGKRYCYGGNGPSCYDCSGLIVKAYKKVGKKLPRTADQIWKSSKTKTVSKSRAKWGDLVFWFSGGQATHVEFLAGKGLKYSYGAHHSGTRIGWRKLYGSPRFAHVNGAG